MKRVAVIHGPNLNLLGEREPHIYGTQTLDTINALLQKRGKDLGFQVRCRQSNSEGDIVDWIQKSIQADQAIVLNPAGYTHTSVAIRDAVSASSIPVIEVHLSNVASREAFRRRSLISPVVKGVISGFGPFSYVLALEALVPILE